jgi:hypothetical protein
MRAGHGLTRVVPDDAGTRSVPAESPPTAVRGEMESR